MTKKEALSLILCALVIVATVTVVGEVRRRSISGDIWLSIPDGVRDSYVTDPSGAFVLDPYGRKKPAQRLDISWMGVPLAYMTDPDCWIKRKLEERFNLNIKPVILDQNQYIKKKPLMFCGGNIPDLCWINDPVNMQKDVDNGFLVAIPYELLKAHAPRIVELVNEYAPHGWAYPLYNGRLYGIPTINGEGRRPKPGVWRSDWLRNVGFLERDAAGRPITDEKGKPRPRAPETLEEMEEVLHRFRDRDPNRSGKRDTYGMSGDITEWWWSTFSEIFGAYGVMPFDWQYDPDTGELTWGGISDAALRTIKTLRRWREQDLIDPDFLGDKMRGEQLPKKFKNGKIGYLGYYAVWWRVNPKGTAGSLHHELRKLDPNAEIAAAVPPIGPVATNAHDILTGAPIDGPHRYRGSRTWGSAGNIICFGRPTAEEPAKVVRILEMLDAMASETDAQFSSGDPLSLFPTNPSAPITGLEWRHGRRLTHWEFGDITKALTESGPGMIPPYDVNAVREKEGFYMDFYALFTGAPDNEDQVAGRDEREFNETYRKPEWGYADVFGKPDVLPSANRYLKTLQNFQLLQYSRMIKSRGQGGIPEKALDQAFASFRTEWLRIGGSVLLDEARELRQNLQAFYDKYGILPGRRNDR